MTPKWEEWHQFCSMKSKLSLDSYIQGTIKIPMLDDP